MTEETKHSLLPTGSEAQQLFHLYMRTCGVPSIDSHTFNMKKLGIVNGGAWIILWSYYFGKLYLPGVQLINVGNEAVQLSFMTAHSRGEPCPPESNIAAFERYALDLVNLYRVDAILLTCSTMNRSAHRVRAVLEPYRVPVVQIDEAMMEQAVNIGGRCLVIATHGPTVENTQTLLQETAERMSVSIDYTGSTVESAFKLLGEGNIEEHNRLIAEQIQKVRQREHVDSVVLAQLSMSVFLLSYPDPEKEFGVPVLTSGVSGFQKIRDMWEHNHQGT
ncbi:MAG: aspartate/glutamate racemase family protein [Spirochaetota bacterium]|nr:aspartate/glutamate racemase family protein [Spirochaetota bacterium]